MEQWLSLFLLLATAAVPLEADRGKGDRGGHWWHKLQRCYPDAAAKKACWSVLPTDVLHSKSVLAKFLPTIDDMYDLDGVQGFDPFNFEVTTIEKDPSYFCQHTDALKKARECMRKETIRRCFWMANSEVYKYFSDQKTLFDKAVQFVCSRLEEIDMHCVEHHFNAQHDCLEKVKKDMGHLEDHGWGDKKHRGRHHRWGRSADPAADSNSTGPADMEDMQVKLCFIEFQKNRCLRDEVRPCSESTAQVLFEMQVNLTFPACAQAMQSWEMQMQSINTPQPLVAIGSAHRPTFVSPLLLGLVMAALKLATM